MKASFGRLAALIVVILAFLPSHASSQNLVQISAADLAKSDVIFSGVCKEARAQRVPPNSPNGVLATAYTFEKIENNIRGAVSDPYTFYQYGATREEAQRLGGLFAIDNPRYEVGKEYLLFLTCSKNEPVLCAPLGLKQGSFKVQIAADGSKSVVNGVGNKNLFSNLPAAKAQSLSKSLGTENKGGPVNFDAFVETIKGLSK